MLWNSGSYLKVKFQCFRSSPGFPLYLSVCNFGSWSLREAEVEDCTCFVFELEFLAGNAPSRQFSCWVKPAIPFGFVEHIAKSMFAHPGSCEG